MSSFSRLSPARRSVGSVPRDVPGEPTLVELAGPLRRAIGRARLALLDAQDADGAWRAAHEQPPALVALALAARALAGQLDADTATAGRDWLTSRLLKSGGWSREPRGDFNLETSLWAYWAAKLVAPGEGPADLAATRRRILTQGGAAAAGPQLRYAWALSGQIPYEACPAAPPEWLWLSGGYRGAPRRGETERALAAAISLLWAERPLRPAERLSGVRELFLEPTAVWPRQTFVVQNSSGGGWQSRALALAERAAAWLERRERVPLRRPARTAIAAWLDQWWIANEACLPEHPASIWAGLALRCTGRISRSDLDGSLRRLFDDWFEPSTGGDTTLLGGGAPLATRLPAIATTSQAIEALAASGGQLGQHSASQAAAWLAESLAADHAEEETAPFAAARAEALAALARLVEPSTSPADAATPQLELIWHGTADDPAEALDQAELLGRIADRLSAAPSARAIGPAANPRGSAGASVPRPGAAWRPGACDRGEELLAQVSELLLAARRKSDGDLYPSARVGSVLARQTADGGWPAAGREGRATVTAEVLIALTTAGVPLHQAEIQSGLSWLLAEQLPDGSWSNAAETRAPETGHHDDPMPPQDVRPTAAALRALVAAELPHHPAAVRGGAWLIAVGEGPTDPAGVAFRLRALAEWALGLERFAPEPQSAPVLQLVADGEEW